MVVLAWGGTRDQGRRLCPFGHSAYLRIASSSRLLDFVSRRFVEFNLRYLWFLRRGKQIHGIGRELFILIQFQTSVEKSIVKKQICCGYSACILRGLSGHLAFALYRMPAWARHHNHDPSHELLIDKAGGMMR
jgi:hypothetical protein